MLAVREVNDARRRVARRVRAGSRDERRPVDEHLPHCFRHRDVDHLVFARLGVQRVEIERGTHLIVERF